MAKGVTIEIQGLKEIQKFYGKLPRTLVVEMDAEMSATAQTYANRVIENIQAVGAIDNGVLMGSVSDPPKKVAEMNYEVTESAGYAAYVEFGTITFVKVPPELSSYAMQFKGKGIRKTGGMPARPHFFPPLAQARAELNKNLKQMMERIAK